jgi:hypothetical protein
MGGNVGRGGYCVGICVNVGVLEDIDVRMGRVVNAMYLADVES